MMANPDIDVAQIADRLGVSPATLYQYIPAAETPDELVQYYHRLHPTTADVHDIIWLQIGSGFPLKSAGCLDQ